MCVQEFHTLFNQLAYEKTNRFDGDLLKLLQKRVPLLRSSIPIQLAPPTLQQLSTIEMVQGAPLQCIVHRRSIPPIKRVGVC